MPDIVGLPLALFGALSAIISAIVVGFERGKTARAVLRAEQARTRTAEVEAQAAEVQARLQGQMQQAAIWEGEARAIRTRADRLQDENAQLTTTVRELSGRTDITQVISLIGESMKSTSEMQERVLNKFSDQFAKHEDRATERHRVTMEAFGHLNHGLLMMSQSLERQAEVATGQAAAATGQARVAAVQSATAKRQGNGG